MHICPFRKCRQRYGTWGSQSHVIRESMANMRPFEAVEAGSEKVQGTAAARVFWLCQKPEVPVKLSDVFSEGAC